MHLTPEAGRRWRRQLIREALDRAAIAAEVAPVVPCPDGEAGYRHVVKLVPVESARGLTLGVYGRHSHTVIPIPDCSVAAPILRRFTQLPPLQLSPGVLRHVVLRASRSEGTVIATLIARHREPGVDRLADALDADGVHLHINPNPGDGIFAHDRPTLHLRGLTHVREWVGDKVFHIGPTDFFQTNPATAARLWADLPRPRGPVLDLYCGIGVVGILSGGQPLYGIEESPAAVARARENAALNKVHATFVAAPAATVALPEALRGAMVIANPPRRGLDASLIPRIAALAPDPLVYISCHPTALSRDLHALLAQGLRIERVQPYDMFPNTPHVETVVILRATNG